MNEFIDYYKLLGIAPSATDSEIKRVYREIARYLHPDAHPGKTFSDEEARTMREQFTLVTDAYHTLKDDDTRREYDRKYKAHYAQIAREEERKRQMEEEQRRQEEQQWREVYNRQQATTTHRTSTRGQHERVRNDNRGRQYSRQSEQHAYYQGQTTQAGYTNEPRRTPRKKESFFQSVKRQYKEVRQDEKKFSFRKRHANIEAAYYDSFAEGVDSIPKEILYYTGKGTVHIFLETLYQLSRLTYINKDQFTKFVIRNRRLAATAAIIGVMVSSGLVGNGNEKDIVREAEDFTTTIETTVEEPSTEDFIEVPVYEPRMILQRNYTIQSGDNLSTLAYNANSSVEDLKQINGYDSNMIYAGRRMSIPYTISTEDLEYYTQNVRVNDYTLQELARSYETDVETLCRLNPEAIIKSGSNYIILSDSIVVPNFITKSELYQRQNDHSATYQ